MTEKHSYKQYPKVFKEEAVALVTGQGYNAQQADGRHYRLFNVVDDYKPKGLPLRRVSRCPQCELSACLISFSSGVKILLRYAARACATKCFGYTGLD